MRKFNTKKKLNTKPKWFDIAVDACCDAEEQIPCMTGVIKGEEKCDVHFRGFARLQRMGEIVTSKSARFKTMTDFNRAAHYIGCLVIYNLVKDDLEAPDRMWGDSLVESLRLTERPIMNAILYDRVLDALKGIKSVFDRGLCGAEEMHDRVSNLIAQLPENMRGPAKKDFQNLLAGRKITELYLTEHHGGVRY